MQLEKDLDYFRSNSKHHEPYNDNKNRNKK